MVMYIKTDEEWSKLMELSKDKLVVVDFTASWCPPCQRIGPTIDAMAAEMTDIEFVKVDVDDASDIASKCGVNSMPTFQFYSGGQKVKAFSGADEQKIRSTIKELS
eukprot:CAMPEP_0194276072 /NCGR_PEP_ID=MMETSP0169-20130528/8752_1 /TAXON_ID=218684 /ORGANISM="Corethron pennatum, Strain L29A3" /LENGTH=105 /DNA_ID=CAMNT_0039019699 /DNA_START=82 /DNA_END=399 /DNA_ORIENTATION=+